MLDSLNGWIGEHLAASTGAGSFLWLFLGGAVASLLPCVYPVYPMTAHFLRTRTPDNSRGAARFAHPLAYYFGMGAMYLSFGLIAASTGGAFNSVLRTPEANLFIGSFLMLLALSTVDWIHLPFFGGQYDTERKGLLGTWLMGAGAGLLSSACVGPIVVGILVAFAAGTTEVSWASVSVAGVKMALFGLGVGLPILLIGVFGMQLPRGGRWMRGVQWAFGGLIAYFAWGYLAKSLVLLHLPTSLIAWAVLFVLAVRAWLPGEDAHRNPRALWALAGVVAILGIVRSAWPAGTSMPSEPSSASSALEQRVGNLVWHLDRDAAYAAAAASGKPVFIDFHADWCSNCKAFQTATQADSALNAALQQAVLLKVYDTSPLFDTYAASGEFPELNIGLPFFLITDTKSNILYRTSDYTATEDMALFLTP